VRDDGTPSDATAAHASQTGAATTSLPVDVPVHRDVEVYEIGEDDERIALRGQARYARGAPAKALS
jgi:hypothetical protein